MDEPQRLGWWRDADGEFQPPEAHPEYQHLVERTRRFSGLSDDRSGDNAADRSLQPTPMGNAIDAVGSGSALAVPRRRIAAVVGAVCLVGMVGLVISLMTGASGSLLSRSGYQALTQGVTDAVVVARAAATDSLYIDWIDLEVGDCIIWNVDDRAYRLACDQRHQAQVVGAGSLSSPDGEVLDAASWDAKVRERCDDLRSSYLGSTAPAELEVGWKRAEVTEDGVAFVCVVSAPNERALEGSLRAGS